MYKCFSVSDPSATFHFYNLNIRLNLDNSDTISKILFLMNPVSHF